MKLYVYEVNHKLPTHIRIEQFVLIYNWSVLHTYWSFTAQIVDMNVFMRQASVTNLKKKNYSFLDHRRNTFDCDFEQFCKSTSELNASLTLNTDELFSYTHTQKNLYRIDVFYLLMLFCLSYSSISWRISWKPPWEKFKTPRAL